MHVQPHYGYYTVDFDFNILTVLILKVLVGVPCGGLAMIYEWSRDLFCFNFGSPPIQSEISVQTCLVSLSWSFFPCHGRFFCSVFFVLDCIIIAFCSFTSSMASQFEEKWWCRFAIFITNKFFKFRKNLGKKILLL